MEAVQAALTLEKNVNQSLLDLHSVAAQHSDAHVQTSLIKNGFSFFQLFLFKMCDFLEDHYLREQVESIKELADHVTNLKRVGPGLGEYMYDKETMNGEND